MIKKEYIIDLGFKIAIHNGINLLMSETEIETVSSQSQEANQDTGQAVSPVLEAVVQQLVQDDKDLPVLVRGEALETLPEDLYIPPHALRVFLEAFTGPLDLLLYLIKKQNIDILDIPIVKITEQYTQYVELIRQMDFDLAAEYLVMAAMLAEIKSRFLLPRHVDIEEEEDPRAELVKRLREYEVFKQAASNLEELPQLERDTFLTNVDAKLESNVFKPKPVVTLDNLLVAMSMVLQRAEVNMAHSIRRETLSVHERMTFVLKKIQANHSNRFIQFVELFSVEEGRAGVIVTFMAILELLRQSMIEAVQSSPFSPIHIKAIESSNYE